MIGLLVQITEEFAKIWSTSSHRLITYIRDELPINSHEGDWVEIEFEPSGAMRGIKKTTKLLETKRDEGGKIHILDAFIVDHKRQIAFSGTFGVVRVVSGMGGGKWTEERRTKDFCILLWMTILSNAQFSIEEQSLERANSKDGKYAEKYNMLMEGFAQVEIMGPTKEVDEGWKMDETILIVGHDRRTNVFFSSSRSGEAFINPSVWKNLNGDIKMEKGATFRARLNKEYENPMHKVVKLYDRVDAWEGVQVILTDRELKVELNAEVVEKRETCLALDTEPFGLVTCPLDRNFLLMDIGDHVRVVLFRFKDELKADYPSKWQVVTTVRILRKAGEKNENSWFEGVVTSISTPFNVLVTFKHGTALCNRNALRDPLSLGDIVDIRVKQNSVKEGFFDVVDIGDEKRKSKDLLIESFDHYKCNVFCIAEVIDRCDTYFLLDTPIIGLVLFFFKEAPNEMEVGDVWRVKMLRRKDKKNYPSFWVATAVSGEYPRVSCAYNREREERETADYTDKSEYLTEDSSTIPSSTNKMSTDLTWTTVIITGSDHIHGFWYGSCAIGDPIRIMKKLNLSDKNLERGAFYRVKISLTSKKVYEVDPERVYPRDIEMIEERNGKDGKQSIKFWCYSRIVDLRESSFTVHNELIGDATLPFTRASQKMRVGDRLETVYYRVKNTDNPTHWMVNEARFARSISSYEKYEKKYESEEKLCIGEKKESRPSDDDKYVKHVIRDNRVLAMTRHFLKFPQIVDEFRKLDSATFAKINHLIRRK